MTAPGNIDGIEITLTNCEACADTSILLSRLGQAGIKYVEGRPDRGDSHPERRIKPDGSIFVPLYITHPLLGRDVRAISFEWNEGVGTLGYVAETKTLLISQGIHTTSVNLEEVAKGQVALAKLLTLSLRPAYGWIDVPAERVFPRRVTTFNDLTRVFFANIISPRILSDAPSRFFDNLPVSDKVRLDDGSLLFVVTVGFSEWICKRPRKLKDYLKKFAPQMEVNRPN